MELTLEQQKEKNRESVSLDEYSLGISSIVQTYRFGGGGDVEAINKQIEKYNELVDLYSQKWGTDESDRKLASVDKPYEISQPIEDQYIDEEQSIKEIEQAIDEEFQVDDSQEETVLNDKQNKSQMDNFVDEHNLRAELNKYMMAYHDSLQICKDSTKSLQRAEIDRDHMSEALMEACKIVAKDHTEKNAKQWYLHFTSLTFEAYIKNNKENDKTLKKVKQNETKEEA